VDYDEEIEDVPSPATVKLEAISPDVYDKDAATTAALAASRVDEDSKWPELDDVVKLSVMMAEHISSLPPPPPLPPHAPPQAARDTKMAPPPPQYVSPATSPQYAQPLQPHYLL
jgi:hypothetical protein